MHHPPHPPHPSEQPHTFELIERPYDLKSKVGPDVGFSEEVLERADQAIDELNEMFTASLQDDLQKLTESVVTYAQTRETKTLMSIVTKCHDLKGNCSTFDYKYMSIIAGLLEDYIIEFIKKPNPLVIELYLTALTRVATDSIKGTSDPLGDTLIKHLNDLLVAERHKAKQSVQSSA